MDFEINILESNVCAHTKHSHKISILLRFYCSRFNDKVMFFHSFFLYLFHFECFFFSDRFVQNGMCAHTTNTHDQRIQTRDTRPKWTCGEKRVIWLFCHDNEKTIIIHNRCHSIINCDRCPGTKGRGREKVQNRIRKKAACHFIDPDFDTTDMSSSAFMIFEYRTRF